MKSNSNAQNTRRFNNQLNQKTQNSDNSYQCEIERFMIYNIMQVIKYMPVFIKLSNDISEFVRFISLGIFFEITHGKKSFKSTNCKKCFKYEN